MRAQQFLACLCILACLMDACSSSRSSSSSKAKKSKITGVRPDVKNPSPSLLNASGDALTPGINSTNRNGAGSEENAAAIASDAIHKANAGLRNQLGIVAFTGDDFISRISTSDDWEIKTGQMILERSENESVKKYAAMVLKDHQAIQEDLDRLSAGTAIKLSDTLITSLQSVRTAALDLNSFKNSDKRTLDMDYVQLTIQDHQNLIRLFEAAGRSDDPQISAFGKRHLPLLRQHLSEAQELTKQIRIP